MTTINDDIVAGPVVDVDDDDDDVGLPHLPGPNHPLRRGPGDGPPRLSIILRWESCEDGRGRPQSHHGMIVGNNQRAR